MINIMIQLKAVDQNYMLNSPMIILTVHVESKTAHRRAYLWNCCLENKICICIRGQIHKGSLDIGCLWASWLF